MPRRRHFRLAYKLPRRFWMKGACALLTTASGYALGFVASYIVQLGLQSLFPEQAGSLWVIVPSALLGWVAFFVAYRYADTSVWNWWARRLKLEPSRIIDS